MSLQYEKKGELSLDQDNLAHQSANKPFHLNKMQP